MFLMSLPNEEIQVQVSTPDVDLLLQAHVLLYNDEWHTFDEVITQLILAIGCTMEVADSMAWDVHTKGVCKVYQGNIEKCLKVSGILEEIELKTEVRF